jgi:hypothetical protein
MTERELAPAFIDEPGPSSSLVEWQAFRDDLARSGIPHIEPILRQADLMIWFKEHGESLTPWEREVMEDVLRNHPLLTPEEALEHLRAAGM